MKRNQKTLSSVLLAMSAMSSIASAQSSMVEFMDERGNGGDVIVCEDNRPAEVLDYFELRVFNSDHTVSLGAKDLSYQEKIELAIARLDDLSPDRAERYRRWAADFESEAKFLQGVEFEDISDSEHIAIPSGCVVKQAVVQQPEASTRYLVADDVWRELDSDQKAGLVLHEIIYRELIASGHTNSIAARRFNGLVSSNAVAGYTVPSFVTLMQDLGFPTLRVSGALFNLDKVKQLPRYFASTRSWSGDVVHGSMLDYEGRQYKVTGEASIGTRYARFTLHPRNTTPLVVMGQDVHVQGEIYKSADNDCVFRPMAAPDSERCRHPIPMMAAPHSKS